MPIERWRVVAAVVGPAWLALALYAYVAPPRPVYEARSLLLVEPDHSRGNEFAASSGGSEPEGSYYETQYRILKSRSLAGQTLEALAKTPTAPSMSKPGGNAREAAPTPAQAAAISAFLGALDVAHIPSSRMIELRFRAPDPAYAAEALAAHVNTYMRQTVSLASRTSRESSAWLDRQAEDQRLVVERGEASLKQFQAQYGAIQERQTGAAQRLSELNAAVERARTLRMSKEASYDRLKAAAATRTSASLVALVPGTVVQHIQTELADLQRKDLELAREYGELHPERQKVRDAIAFTSTRLDAEVARALDAQGNELGALIAEEQQLASTLSRETGAAGSLARRAADYDALKRQVDGDRALYEKLRQRTREMTLSGGYDISSVRVIDAVEEPRTPMASRRPSLLAAGAFGSLCVGLLLAFGVHYVDGRVRSPHDVHEYLGLPALGVLPAMNGAAMSRRIFDEAMRDLRTHIVCGATEQPSRTLLVASADSEEGKTLVATNLASGLAQIGRRVLVIDGDLRRPRVHDAFDVPMQPGLSEVLAGAIQPSACVRMTNHRNLWVLPAGRPDAHPGDLLSSGAFQAVLKALSASFDDVVIDSPPVLAATDASLVAHQRADIIFVVSADRTARRAAQAAIERLDAVGARFVGVVLNRVVDRPDHVVLLHGPPQLSVLRCESGRSSRRSDSRQPARGRPHEVRGGHSGAGRLEGHSPQEPRTSPGPAVAGPHNRACESGAVGEPGGRVDRRPRDHGRRARTRRRGGAAPCGIERRSRIVGIGRAARARCDLSQATAMSQTSSYSSRRPRRCGASMTSSGPSRHCSTRAADSLFSACPVHGFVWRQEHGKPVVVQLRLPKPAATARPARGPPGERFDLCHADARSCARRAIGLAAALPCIEWTRCIPCRSTSRPIWAWLERLLAMPTAAGAADRPRSKCSCWCSTSTG